MGYVGFYVVSMCGVGEFVFCSRSGWCVFSGWYVVGV